MKNPWYVRKDAICGYPDHCYKMYAEDFILAVNML